MQKLKIFFLSLILIFAISTGVRAEFFSDVIVTSPNGIWTDSRSYTNLNDAVTAVGTVNQRTIVIASPQTVTALTVPSNITLRFERDGAIVNSGQLTINTKNIISDGHKIFAGLGDIDFAAGTVVKLSWFHNLWNALTMTSDDHVTMVIDKAINATASCAVGADVTLRWEAPNIITANAGVTVSNIGQIESGSYQILAGAGNFRFRDGTTLNLEWFPYLRMALTWINTTDATIVVNESSDVDYSDSVPLNIQLKINNGGALDIAPGVTLTIANSKQIDIGPYYFDPFTGTGSVAITGGATYTPATGLTGLILNQLVTLPKTIPYEVDALYDYGGGTAYTKATIDAALTAIGTTNKATLLLRPGTWVISVDADYSAYANVTWKLPAGTLIQIASGKTLTISGPFEAGLYQVFSCVGTGKVVSGTINEVYPEWWGAKGDGINDDSSAILNSVEFNTVVLCSTSIYKISVNIIINHNINIIGNNSTLNFINDKYLTLSGSRGTPEPILSDITCGDKNISINNSSLQKGDLFLLQNDLDYSMSLHRYYYKMADFLEVFEVDVNNIYTNEYIQDSYPSANSLIFKITTFKFSIKDLNIISTDTSPYTVKIFCGKDCILNNVNTIGGSYSSIILDSCYNTIIDNCKIYNNSIINIGYNYGLSISQSKNVKVTNSRLYSLRHAVAVGNSGYGLSRNILIDNCTLSNNYELGRVYCADFHGSVINGEYRNCSITGGASLAGINTRYINNTIIAPVGNYPAINLTELVGGVFIIDGNTIIEPLGNINSSGCIKSTASDFLSTISYDYNLIITNNIFEVSSAQRHILLFGTHDSAPNVKPTVYLNNNYFKGFTSTLLSYVKYNGGSNVAPKSVTISNFHKGDLPNTFILFDRSTGLLSGCKVTTPRDNYLVPLTITSGNYDATTTVSFDYIHCKSIKGPANNFYTPIKCSIRNTLINGDTYLFSSIQYNDSTSASILITTGNTTQLVTDTMTYYVDVEVGGSFIYL